MKWINKVVAKKNRTRKGAVIVVIGFSGMYMNAAAKANITELNIKCCLKKPRWLHS